MTVQGEEPAGTPPAGFRVSRGRAPTPGRGRHEMLPAIVNTSPSAMSPPPLRRPFPGSAGQRTDVPPGHPCRFPLQVAVPEVLHVRTVRKWRFRQAALRSDTNGIKH
jgi:hypothetical protein